MIERMKTGRIAAAAACFLLAAVAAAPTASAAPAPRAGDHSSPQTSSLRAASSTLLMTWYSDAGWRGTSAGIYGSYGTCDTAGYGFTPSDWWKTHMSSIRGAGQCNKVRLTNIAGTASATYSLPVSFGSTIFNDNVGYVKVWHG